jgi:hypothetical protein
LVRGRENRRQKTGDRKERTEVRKEKRNSGEGEYSKMFDSVY